MKELLQIQTRLNAPKDKKNKFGNFNYRSAEDILAAAKPFLAEMECTLTMDDDLVLIGDRYYIKTTVVLENKEGEKKSAHAFAREQDKVSGQVEAQITGACSSYARKYALCGLFAIDDSKADPDNDENAKGGEVLSSTSKPASMGTSKAGTPTTSKPESKGAKEKPLIQDGNALWTKAIDYCVKNNRKAADLRKSYIISDADIAKMQEIIDFQKDFVGN